MAMIDNATLLIGIAFSSASLMIALLVGWLNSRHETYLVFGSAGIGLVVTAVAIMGLRNGNYDLFVQAIPFTVLVIGFALIHAGARRFRNAGASLVPSLLLGLFGILITLPALLLGYSGIGTIGLNIAAAIILFLCGLEHWHGREDARMALLTNTVLYTLAALSFLACAVMLVINAQWILDAPPKNWAEDVNSIMSLVGLTGIGAITLTLHHARAARRHRTEANTDSLTGVLNRRALFERFNEAEKVPGLAVVMFDLDHFKQINDRLGHAHGDEVLLRFAEVLRANLRESDVIARVGGEEFCVILPGLDRAASNAAAERVRVAFADLGLAIGSDGQIATVSAGLANGGMDETFSSVLRRADDALYKAKSAGRNQVHVAAFRLVA